MRTSSTTTPGHFIGDLFKNNGVRYQPATDSQRTKYRPERTVLTDATDFSSLIPAQNDIEAVYPYIDVDAMAVTMQNYRNHIAAYNEKVKAFNWSVDQHNEAVKKFRDENKLTDVQIQFSALFYKKNQSKRTAEYNRLADAFNEQYGLLVERKRLQTVKYATEFVFQQILYYYSTQLAKITGQMMKLGSAIAKPLPAAEINAFEITDLRRGEAKSLAVCSATVRNHRERLEEAGVLDSYEFRGHKRAVKMKINSNILVVFDAKSRQLVGAENQSLTPETCKEFENTKEVTRPNKRNIKNKENGSADFQENGTASPEFSSVFYKIIPKQGADSAGPAAPENVKVSPSDKLLAQIQHPQELANRLADGEFVNYSPIDIRILQREAYDGTLTKDQFAELLIQDFFKSSARLWRASSPYPGSWKKAINAWMENRFWMRNQSGEWLYHKQLMVKLIQEYRWRITNAEKWFRKTGIKPLYPGDYFDFSRKRKEELGFEYTKTAWERHLKYLEQKPKKVAAGKREAEKRAVRIDYSKRFQNQLNRFFRGRISFEDLHDYVINNLPKQYHERLAETVLNISVTKTNYTT